MNSLALYPHPQPPSPIYGRNKLPRIRVARCAPLKKGVSILNNSPPPLRVTPSLILERGTGSELRWMDIRSVNHGVELRGILSIKG